MPWLCPTCAMPDKRKARLRPSVPCQEDPPNPARCVLNCSADALVYFAAGAFSRGKPQDVPFRPEADVSLPQEQTFNVLAEGPSAMPMEVPRERRVRPHLPVALPGIMNS